MNVPYSPIGHHPMELLMTIPLDWRRPKDRRPFHLFWCKTSQYGMLYPRPASDEIAEFYDVADYYTHDKTIATSSREQMKPSFFGWLLKRLSWEFDDSVYIENEWIPHTLGREPSNALDIGCGSGKILARLRAEGHRVVGVDPDPVARDVAHSRGLHVLAGTAEALPDAISSEQYDAIFMTHVLEHTVDPIQAIHNAIALLKPNGKLIIETPNNAAIGFEQAGAAWRWLDIPRHLNFFTPQSLRAMCELVGLQHQATEFRGFSRQFLPEWISDEQRIWDRYKAIRNISLPLPRRNTQWQAWKLFKRTAFAPDEKKYDSVRIIAVKPE